MAKNRGNNTGNTRINTIGKRDNVFAFAKVPTTIVSVGDSPRIFRVDEGTQVQGLAHWDEDNSIYLMITDISQHNVDDPFDAVLLDENWDFSVMVQFERLKS